MVNIDYIFDLIDWNNSENIQQHGIQLAREVKSINVFLQPCDKEHNKNVWDNCAIILSERTDEELSPYLTQLLQWLQDMNWPGAFCILDRIKHYKDKKNLDFWYKYNIKLARALKDEVWEENLNQIFD